MTAPRPAYAAAGRHNARSVEYYGIQFDSQAEGRRYLTLRQMQDDGEISNLTVHRLFILQPAFRCRGRSVRAITFTVDFDYCEGDVWVAEDVKPFKWNDSHAKRVPVVTEDFQLKKKMFQYQHPDCDFRLVEA